MLPGSTKWKQPCKQRPPARGRSPVINAATEIAFRRAEAKLWLASSSQIAIPFKECSELTQQGVDLLLEALRKDKVGIEPVLLWLDRWSDAHEDSATREELVVILRQLEPLARQHHQEGSRYIAESDLLMLAGFRLRAEHALAQQREEFTQAQVKTSDHGSTSPGHGPGREVFQAAMTKMLGKQGLRSRSITGTHGVQRRVREGT